MDDVDSALKFRNEKLRRENFAPPIYIRGTGACIASGAFNPKKEVNDRRRFIDQEYIIYGQMPVTNTSNSSADLMRSIEFTRKHLKSSETLSSLAMQYRQVSERFSSLTNNEAAANSLPTSLLSGSGGSSSSSSTGKRTASTRDAEPAAKRRR